MSVYDYGKVSPYSATYQYSWRLGRYRHITIPASVDDQRFTITPKYLNRPDLLSFDRYQTPIFWWVFASRNINVIRDPIWDFTVGKTIIIPPKSVIEALS